MELDQTLIDLFLHLDRHLTWVFENYGLWTDLILFLIIFCETLVVTPFLPGDSLLFGVGARAAGSSLNVGWLFILLSIAAIVGDAVNYWTGSKIGAKLLQREDGRFIKKEYIDRTHRFYEKYGARRLFLPDSSQSSGPSLPSSRGSAG